MLGSQAPKSLQVLTLASVPCIARWAPEEERQGSGVDQPPNVIPFMVHDSCHTRKAPEEAGRAAGRPVGGLGWTGAADTLRKSGSHLPFAWEDDAAGGGWGQKGGVQRDVVTRRAVVVR